MVSCLLLNAVLSAAQTRLAGKLVAPSLAAKKAHEQAVRKLADAESNANAEDRARKLQRLLEHAYKSLKRKDDLIETLQAKVKALEIILPHLRGDYDYHDDDFGDANLAGPRT
jgi:hypothetical protein